MNLLQARCQQHKDSMLVVAASQSLNAKGTRTQHVAHVYYTVWLQQADIIILNVTANEADEAQGHIICTFRHGRGILQKLVLLAHCVVRAHGLLVNEPLQERDALVVDGSQTRKL